MGYNSVAYNTIILQNPAKFRDNSNKVIQGHQSWCQSKAHMRLPITVTLDVSPTVFEILTFKAGKWLVFPPYLTPLYLTPRNFYAVRTTRNTRLR